MKKIKPVVGRIGELAKALGLTPADGLEIEIRSDLNDKIIEVVKDSELTHSQVAKICPHVTNSHYRHPESKHS